MGLVHLSTMVCLVDYLVFCYFSTQENWHGVCRHVFCYHGFYRVLSVDVMEAHLLLALVTLVFTVGTGA